MNVLCMSEYQPTSEEIVSWKLAKVGPTWVVFVFFFHSYTVADPFHISVWSRPVRSFNSCDVVSHPARWGPSFQAAAAVDRPIRWSSSRPWSRCGGDRSWPTPGNSCSPTTTGGGPSFPSSPAPRPEGLSLGLSWCLRCLRSSINVASNARPGNPPTPAPIPASRLDNDTDADDDDDDDDADADADDLCRSGWQGSRSGRGGS